MARLIALYLPQYHPIPENDEWWGKGFTEWHNLARAKKLFPGHRQPNLPGELGFYDLRLEETRIRQAQLAREAGIEGFCYWHYWFGNGKKLLERPLQEVVASGKPDFPFCVGWANHSWERKLWDKNGTKEVLIEQTYPGKEDWLAHFNFLSSAFVDQRYIRVNGKLFFIIWGGLEIPDIDQFLLYWRKLAAEKSLGDFYFVAAASSSVNRDKFVEAGFDAIYIDGTLGIHRQRSLVEKGVLRVLRNIFSIPTIYSYKDAIRYMVSGECKNRGVIPAIAPNWDHSPRSGAKGIVFHKSSPQLFGQVLKRAIETVENKPEEEKIVIIKSWNEWGEGNYLEPDTRFGDAYLEEIKRVLNL